MKISDGKAWEKKAEERAQLIRQYLWNEERGLFLDYDFVNKKHTPIASIVTLWPLYWEFATKKEALAWERQFLMQTHADLNMTLESFCELYEVLKAKKKW